MAEKTYTFIPAELKSAQVGGVVVSAEGVYDYQLNKNQQIINQEQKLINQGTIQYDSENNQFVKFDEQGNKVVIDGLLTETVVNYIEGDEQLGNQITEIVVNNIADGEKEFADQVTNSVIETIAADENYGNDITNIVVQNIITNNSLDDKYVSEEEFSEFQDSITGGITQATKVENVKVNDTSILENKIANILVEGNYSSSNKIATMSAVTNIPSNSTFMTNLTSNQTFDDYISSKISSEGGDTNVIEVVKVNNSALTPTNKAVNISVPTEISQLNGGSTLVGDVNNLTTDLENLTTDLENLADTVQGITSQGGEPNRINTITINNSSINPDSNKNVDLTNSVVELIEDTLSDSSPQNPITIANSNITNLSSTTSNITNLTTTTHARTIYEETTSSSSININAINGDIQIITLETSSNPIATVSGIDISNAKVGQNITVILKTAVQGGANIQVVNNNFYIWNNKDNEQSSGIVTLTAPQDGYCEISFLCFAKNVTINNITRDRFYVRGV